MIQRIQSVLLFLTFLLNGAIFFNELYYHAVTDPQQWMGITFAIVLTISALLPLIAIFLYSNRQNQLRWVNTGLLAQLIVLGFACGIYVSLGGFGTFLWGETIGLGLLVLAFATEFFARKKIKDDIELVKSMDRIR